MSERDIPETVRAGTWPVDYIGRAFVAGAAWWQFYKNGATAWASERDEMEAEALRRYGPPEEQAADLAALRAEHAEMLAALKRINALPPELAGDAWRIAREAIAHAEAHRPTGDSGSPRVIDHVTVGLCCCKHVYALHRSPPDGKGCSVALCECRNFRAAHRPTGADQ